MTYLLAVYGPAQGKNVPPARMRELRTHAETLGRVLAGDTAGALDIVVQRMKALEVLTSGGSPEMASQHELTPKDEVSLLTGAEKLVAARGELLRLKLAEAAKPKKSH